MNTAGSTMVGMTGGAVGAPNMINQAGARSRPTIDEGSKRLNTYIFGHLIHLRHFELARQFEQVCPIKTLDRPKKEMNGDSDMDMDSKDGLKRPDDLPIPDLPDNHSENSFLHDWWSQFWDIYGAARKNIGGSQMAENYLNHNSQQNKLRQMHQAQMLRNGNVVPMTMPQLQPGMQPNGMNMQKQAMANSNTRNGNIAMMKMQNLQRDGSMTGEQRPQSPGSMGNAPSPSKRPRLDDGNFNGQPGQAGRGQPMQGNQMGNMPGPNGGMMVQNGIPIDMNQQQMAGFGQNSNGQQKLEMGGGMPQQGMENTDMMSQQQRMANNVPAGGASNGNHALQDYQMQLMLLEQQNKKRLLMARQEQDNVNHMPAGSAPGGQIQFANAPAMSPSNSRAGPSPNPNDQMKRISGAPKMGPGNMPGSPAMAGDMNRGSPVPGFDPNGVPPNMRHQAFVNQQGMMNQPPSSHPNFNMQQQMAGNMNPQVEQQMRLAAQQGRLPNSQWQPGQGPPNQMMQNPGQPGQIGTPQLRNAMPPPPAPNSEQQRTQPSSPAQPAGPPTPSQPAKAAPKGKKEAAGKKKAAPKKGGAAATPVADDAPPATPTPSTPITPMHSATFGNNKPGANAIASAASAAPPQSASIPMMDNSGGLFSDLNGDNAFGDNLNFTPDGPDMLENFDFDSFLHNTEDGNTFSNFDFMPELDGTQASAM